MFDIPRIESLKLRDFPTLRHVVQFVFDHRPELKVATAGPLPSGPGGPSAEGHVIAAATPVAAPPGVPPAPLEVAGGALSPVGGAALGPAAVADEVTAKVLAIVAEKTGYPSDMLEMDLDLEADLGVDTVK